MENIFSKFSPHTPYFPKTPPAKNDSLTQAATARLFLCAVILFVVGLGASMVTFLLLFKTSPRATESTRFTVGIKHLNFRKFTNIRIYDSFA